MDYADGGDLWEFIKLRFEYREFLVESQILDWLAQLASALAYVHMLGFMHRDIKTSNIFFNKAGQVMLGDFGIACEVGPGTEFSERFTPLGTPYVDLANPLIDIKMLLDTTIGCTWLLRLLAASPTTSRPTCGHSAVCCTR
jgi:serine/threonine protein kinase